jgi:D-alanyl-D-alanine carboxypeptidase
MNYVAFVCLLFVCQLTSALSLFARDGSPNFRRLVDSYANHRGFNGTVLIARGGKVLFRRSYGQADAQWAIPTQPEALYRIGSLSKPLIATLVLQLVEQGRLQLNGTLGAYLPALYAGTPASSVTVAQLLSHTSGLADVPARYDDV